jgi:calcineurin-like phosphoesterase family protein
MVNIFFASDHHLHHTNIIKYANRPYKNAEEMNEDLIARHNATVRPEDHVYLLGDFSILRRKREWPLIIAAGHRFNGHKRLILGNHDHCPVEVYEKAGFEKIYGVWGGIDGLMLSHIPIHPASLGYRFRANVHGHIHNHPAYAPVVHEGQVKPYINLSVEAINYTPVSLDYINDLIRKAQS